MRERSLHIRLAQTDEASLVHALMQQAFAETLAQAHPSSALKETVDDVHQAMARGGALLALVEGEPVGTGRFEWRARPDGRRALSFERLAVAPEWRGRGIGGALIAWLEDHARRGGAQVVEATVRSEQPDNRPYYLARGYRIVGYSGRYGLPRIRTHVEKDLPDPPP
jgi:predicted N-acetyltransferase YhbS